MIDLPLLWVPGCVVFPREGLDVTLRGRGRVRALWTAEEESGGDLLVAPGSFAPRRAEDLPEILCVAQVMPEIIEGGRRLFGRGRVRVLRVVRAGRGRFVQVEPLAPDEIPPQGALDSARSAWEQLASARGAAPPRTDDVFGVGSDPLRLAWIMASLLPASTEERLRILAENDMGARLRRATSLLQDAVDVAILERQIVEE